MGVQQTNIFEFLYEQFKPKKIRLYQFFAGIGSQAKALKNLGVEFEDYKIAEWAVPSIKAYNYIHTKDFTDYSKGKSRDELIQVVKNVSLDYNKPITEKQLNSKSDEWVREVYNHIIATHNLVNIMEVHGKDLEIDTNYTNIIFYSFPCQDLSKAGLSDSQIYHCAGDSIVVSVLMGIFGTLLGVEDYEQRINKLTDRLATKRKL